MEVPVVIPQVFYDVIARVLPGYLFLIMLRLVLHGKQIDVRFFQLSPPEHPGAWFINAVGYVALCYFIGWFLRLITIRNSEKKRQEMWNKKRQERDEGEIPLSSLRGMFHRVRLRNPPVAFRLLKLRAEARMLETARKAMVCCFVLGFLLLLGEHLQILSPFQYKWGWWAAKLGIPLVMGVAFWKHEQSAWDHYFGNIVAHHHLLFTEEARPKGIIPKLEGSAARDEQPAQPDK